MFYLMLSHEEKELMEQVKKKTFFVRKLVYMILKRQYRCKKEICNSPIFSTFVGHCVVELCVHYISP